MNRPPRIREPILDLVRDSDDRIVDETKPKTRAALVVELLETVVHERNVFAVTIEMLNLGIILTDGSGRVSQANRTARALLDAATGLRQIGGRLFASAPDCAIELHHAVGRAEDGLLRHGIAVPILGGDHVELLAWVFPAAPFRHPSRADQTRAGAVIFVQDLGGGSSLPTEFLMRRFGMTSAECRLLELLTRGRTVTEAAAALNTSLTTTKTHLAHLFRKTGTRRQADLVRLAIRTLAPASI